MTSFEGQTEAFHAPVIGTSPCSIDRIPKSQPFVIMTQEKNAMSPVPATNVIKA